MNWVLIDTEHNPLTESHVQGLLYALSGSDVTGMVRVRANREEHVKWVLDAGAGGVIIPSVENAADARHAVEICKYHPLGRRGYGPNHASGFWSRTTEYLANANRDIVLICQIELASAVAEVEEICRIEGIDGIWIGPTDLAQIARPSGRPQPSRRSRGHRQSHRDRQRAEESMGNPRGHLAGPGAIYRARRRRDDSGDGHALSADGHHGIDERRSRHSGEEGSRFLNGGKMAGSVVTIGKDRILSVNGKPFFPIGARHIPAGATLGLLKQVGFNSFRWTAFGTDTALIPTAQLPSDLGGLMFYPYVFNKADLSAEAETRRRQLTELIQMVREHPALLCYEQRNEPAYTAMVDHARPQSCLRV